jgi:hypothetical protein
MANYQVVVEKWDGYVRTENVVIAKGTFKVCAAKAEELDETVEFMGEYDWSEDYQRWEKLKPELNGEFAWADIQVRRIRE